MIAAAGAGIARVAQSPGRATREQRRSRPQTLIQGQRHGAALNGTFCTDALAGFEDFPLALSYNLALFRLRKTSNIGGSRRRNCTAGNLVLKLDNAMVADDGGITNTSFRHAERRFGFGLGRQICRPSVLIASKREFGNLRGAPLPLPFVQVLPAKIEADGERHRIIAAIVRHRTPALPVAVKQWPRGHSHLALTVKFPANQRAVPAASEGQRRQLFDEPLRERLGQCSDGEFLFLVEDLANSAQGISLEN